MDNILIASPEIFLSVSALLILMFGTFFNKPVICNFLSIFAVIGCFFLIIGSQNPNTTFLNDLFINDEYSLYIKLIILLFAFFVLLVSTDYIKKIKQFEYSVLLLLSVVGMMLMVSANNFMSLYMALELSSFPIYILVAIEKNNLKSSEAGMKYFILGAIASGILLYGCSLIYGVNGSLDFNILSTNADASIASVIGMILIVSGIAFKISAVPFHMWTPDVYEGSPTTVTILISTIPKIAAVCMLIRMLFVPFAHLIAYWQDIILFLSVLSIAVGTFGALWQKKIKRLFAYSTIANIGYVTLGVAMGTIAGIQGVIVYITIYAIASLGAFSFILMMRKGDDNDINSLAGLAKENPALSLGLAVIMLSMASIPPFAGFFGKIYIFIPLMDGGFFAIAVFGILMSVVSAFYYLRIIKIMYLDSPSMDDFDDEDGSYICACSACSCGGAISQLAPITNINKTVFFITSGLLALFFIYPNSLFELAGIIAKGLF